MFKKILVAFISFSLAYSPIAMAQSQSPMPVGWYRTGVGDTWMGPSKIMNGGGNGIGQAIWNSATKGAVTVTTSANLAVATGDAALVVKSVATGSAIFTATRTVLGVASGAGLIANTAILLSPLVADYFTTENSKLGPLSARETDKPFLKSKTTADCFNGTCYEYRLNDNAPWGDLGSACSQGISNLNASGNGINVYSLTGTVITGTCLATRLYTWAGTTSNNDFTVQRRVLPPSTGLEWVPASMDDIAPYMDAPTKITTPAQLAELVKQGAKVDLSYSQDVIDSYFPSGTLSKPVTGPASVPGTPTVTKTNDGSKTTTTTTTPRTDIGYSTGTDADGKTVPKVTATSGTSSVTTVTDNATGQPVGSPVTTDTTKPATQDTPDLCALHPEIVACATVDEVDMCKKYPDSLACQKTDEPEVPDLEELEKPVTFTPDHGWLAGVGSCPAPRHLSSGSGADFSFQPYCDFMTALRPVFIGVAWLSGAMILIGANRKE